MGVILALIAAFSFGLADFLGGVLSKRFAVWTVAFVMQVAATASLLVMAVLQPVAPGREALVWGGLAGLANGVGTVFLYRGLAIGRMGVVAPVSGALAATIPVLVGVLSGERPSLLAWVGVLLALPGIWLVARTPETETQAPYSGAREGLAAGICFGVLFVFLARIPTGTGWLPLAVSESLAGAIVAVVAVLIGQRWLPRERGLWPAVPLGVVVAIAMVAFVSATHHGYLSITSVLSSLYPGVTVLLAVTLTREAVHRVQVIGLCLCAVAVALVASG